MTSPIRLLSTDFDGTLHAEYEDPPVPQVLQDLISDLQAQGMIWVINTGRDLSSLMETLGRAHLSIWPDYIVTVEREIHTRSDSQYFPLTDWNHGCELAHRGLFERVRPDVPRLTQWIKARFHATIYEDPYSPFCLIAGNNPEADAIHSYLLEYCEEVPDLTVVRNDVYARFSHVSYNKGAALGEIARRVGAGPETIVAVGDHLNDLPMLSTRYAKWLIAPGNAVPVVKETVQLQKGFLAKAYYGQGVYEGLIRLLGSFGLESVNSGS